MKKKLKYLLKLAWENYKNDQLSIFTGWFVIIVMLFVWLEFRDTTGTTPNYDPFVLASSIGVCCVRVCCLNLSRTIFLLKNSNFILRIKYGGLSKSLLIFSIFLFNLILIFVMSLVLFAIGMCFKSQRDIIGNVNWKKFIIGFLLLVATCQLLGIILGVYFKSYEWIMTIGLLNYFFSMYFLGLGIPYTLISSNKFLYSMGYILPQRPIIILMDWAWLNTDSMKGVYRFGYHNNPWLLYTNIVLYFSILILIIFSMSFGEKIYNKYENNLLLNIKINDFKANINKLNSKKEIEDYLKNNSLQSYKNREKRSKNEIRIN